MPHWKTLFNYQHLGCQDLPRDKNDNVLDLTVTIKSIGKRDIKVEGGRDENVVVAELIGSPKPMIMNKTNLKTLADLFGSSEIKDMIGKPFTLYAARVRGKAGGMVDGLRIRENLPAAQATPQKPDLAPGHARWQGAKDAIKEGLTTLEAVKNTFSLTPENEKLLIAKS